MWLSVRITGNKERKRNAAWRLALLISVLAVVYIGTTVKYVDAAKTVKEYNLSDEYKQLWKQYKKYYKLKNNKTITDAKSQQHIRRIVSEKVYKLDPGKGALFVNSNKSGFKTTGIKWLAYSGYKVSKKSYWKDNDTIKTKKDGYKKLLKFISNKIVAYGGKVSKEVEEALESAGFTKTEIIKITTPPSSGTGGTSGGTSSTSGEGQAGGLGGITVDRVDDDEADRLNKLKERSADEVRKTVKNMVNTYGVYADIENAGTTLAPLSNLLKIITGMIVYVAMLCMVLVTSIDVLYITMPVFREKMDARSAEKDGLTREGEQGHRWVSDEAVYSVKSGVLETGKSALSIYLGKRVYAFIVMMVVIFILLTGNISLITDIVLNIVYGIMSALAGINV